MYKITSYFGSREPFRSKGHSGIDFAMERGTELKSIRDGIVERVVDYGSQNIGKGVVIKFNDGNTCIYGHMSDTTVIQGQTIHAGQLIGHSGNSGHVVGSNGGYHLHFGVKEGSEFINPSPYIQDIQHMNDANYFVQSTPSQLNFTFTDFMNYHMSSLHDSLSQIKINLVNSLFDNTMFTQIFQHMLQFFTLHSSFIQDVIRSIF